jgi:hypothetical protein
MTPHDAPVAGQLTFPPAGREEGLSPPSGWALTDILYGFSFIHRALFSPRRFQKVENEAKPDEAICLQPQGFFLATNRPPVALGGKAIHEPPLAALVAR